MACPEPLLESYVVQSGDTCNSVTAPGGALAGTPFSDVTVCQQPPSLTDPPTCGTLDPLALAIGDTFWTCVDPGFVCPTTITPTPTPTGADDLPCTRAPEKRVVQSGDSCGGLTGDGGAFAGLDFSEVSICRVVEWNIASPVLTCDDSDILRANDELYTCAEERQRGLIIEDDGTLVCPIPNRRAGQFGSFPGTPVSALVINEKCFEPAIETDGLCKGPYDLCLADDDCAAAYTASRNVNARYFDVLDQEVNVFDCQDFKEELLSGSDPSAAQSRLLTDVYACQCQDGCIAPADKIDDDLLWGLQKWEVALMFTFLFVGGWVCVQGFIIWYRRNTQSKETKQIDNEIEALRVEQSNAKHY